MGKIVYREESWEILSGHLENMFKEYPNSKLYIIGEGPLREQVEGEIARLNLKDKVILTGNLINPFTLMKKCKCFILPSIYEGQPMVLLEARIVGLPIIVSDFFISLRIV